MAWLPSFALLLTSPLEHHLERLCYVVATNRVFSSLILPVFVQKWVADLNKDFLERFAALLPGSFKDMAPAVVLALLQPKLAYSTSEMENCATQAPEIRKSSGQVLDAHDLKRLQVRCLPAQTLFFQARKMHPFRALVSCVLPAMSGPYIAL